MRKVLSLSFLVFISLTFSVFAQQNRELVQEESKTEQKVEQKFALVIGNSAYESSPLKNPVNDARAISQTLSALGFQVILKENINQVEMKLAVREFGGKIKNGGVGLFYFAGHGVQVKGQNYLVPIGATITKEEEVEYEGLDVGFVMAQMDAAKNRMNIVILDACRNNPFARSYRSESNGLASISAPSGTLIAYATAPGSVASDGDGANGLYTQELLFNLKTVGLNIEEVFKRVRISVRQKTQNKQTPWESSSLTGDFYFVNSGEVKPKTANQQIQIPTVDSTAIELAYWNSIKDSNDLDDYDAYLKKYPNGQFVEIARKRTYSAFSNSDEFVKEFMGQRANKFYPLKIQGRNSNGESQFRAFYVPYKQSATFDYGAFINQTEKEFEINDKREKAKGALLIFLQQFVDAKGIVRYQAIWVKD